MPDNQKLDFYHKRLTDLCRHHGVMALMGWDMNVYMPSGGARTRADQIQYMALRAHELVTDPEFARVVDDLGEDPDSLSENDRIGVKFTKKALDKERKLPADFVAECAQTRAMSHDTWVKARPANDFAAVKPYLEKLVEQARKRSDLWGYEEHPYDPLLDCHDSGATLAVVKPLLVELGEELRGLTPRIAGRFEGIPQLKGPFDQTTQNRLCRKIAESLGFDFTNGRLDISPHPFMTTFGPNDLRITTRYSDDDFLGSLYGVIHETGHALYEMGLPQDYLTRPPLGDWMSSSIHESQSRLWENQVGRSREFTKYLCGVLKEFFPAVADLGPDTLWMHVNRVEPSLIRTEADEVTYSLHIVIRMLLEEQLITGTMAVADVPEAWGDMYEKYLGIRPPDDKDGVMQDTHWFGGGFGYFPSYALGNLYNAMMMDAARQAIPDLSGQIERGEFGALLGWLRENVHSQGAKYLAPELIRHITGKYLSAKPFVEYLSKKFA